ncbi:Cellulose synthase [Corchorus olitorius]|uniref:Cellulose synthase n=1 Tax=Corchorus olitorius TaxID=93759 RepID=A0A1R3GAZ6_9ROSI|nr:Cellulose synthase [Corchorus olitorius]
MGRNGYLPLFETRPAKGLALFRAYAASIFIAIFFLSFYRITYFPVIEGKPTKFAWIGMFLSELWFAFYFFIIVIVRWNRVFRYTFKDRLSSRYEEETLPGVDIFVCTVDPGIEPPIMVINTVLSLMAYDYPPEKLSVYLSDDGCSDLTFYALLEASRFSELWLPFCRKLKIEPRSPEVYFKNTAEPADDVDSAMAKEWLHIKKCLLDTERQGV